MNKHTNEPACLRSHLDRHALEISCSPIQTASKVRCTKCMFEKSRITTSAQIFLDIIEVGMIVGAITRSVTPCEVLCSSGSHLAQCTLQECRITPAEHLKSLVV